MTLVRNRLRLFASAVADRRIRPDPYPIQHRDSYPDSQTRGHIPSNPTQTRVLWTSLEWRYTRWCNDHWSWVILSRFCRSTCNSSSVSCSIQWTDTSHLTRPGIALGHWWVLVFKLAYFLALTHSTAISHLTWPIDEGRIYQWDSVIDSPPSLIGAPNGRPRDLLCHFPMLKWIMSHHITFWSPISPICPASLPTHHNF